MTSLRQRFIPPTGKYVRWTRARAQHVLDLYAAGGISAVMDAFDMTERNARRILARARSGYGSAMSDTPDQPDQPDEPGDEPEPEPEPGEPAPV